MTVQQQIEKQLKDTFTPVFLSVENESHMHSVPKDSETHFKVVIVTSVFEGKRAVQRHQMIYGLLQDHLNGGVHALALHTYTPGEWAEVTTAPDSPNCMGGSKAET